MCAQRLRVAMEEMIENAASGGRNFESDKKFGRQVRADVYASGSDTGNPLSNEISAAVKAIEEHLRSHLSRS